MMMQADWTPENQYIHLVHTHLMPKFHFNFTAMPSTIALLHRIIFRENMTNLTQRAATSASFFSIFKAR